MTSLVEMREVEKFFNSKGIKINSGNVWFRSCVECFRSQSNNYTIKELIDFVYEQWLLADLKEVCCFTLPKECTNEKFTLLGNHAVQLNYSVDVSTSSYAQFQKIRKPDFGLNLDITSDRDIEEQSYFHKKNEKRSLKLEITDGQLTVIGFEDKSIPCLKNPVPGEKALLKGPIECRMGVLMLSDKNIEILGGEVDTLLIPNAVVNVLARALGEPEDPDPYKQTLESSNDDGKEILSNYLEDDDDALLLLAESMDAETLPPPSNLTNSETLIGTNENSLVVSDNFESFEDDDFDLVAAQTASMAEIEALRPKTAISSEDRNDTEETSSLNRIRTQKPNIFASTSTAVTKPFNSSDIVEYVDMNDPKRLKKELEKSYGSGAAYHRIKLEQNSRLLETNRSNTNHSLISDTSLNRYEETDKGSSNLFGSSSASPSYSKRKAVVEQEFSSTKSNSFRDSKQMETLDDSNISPSCITSDVEEDLDMDLSEPECDSNVNVESFHQPYPPRKFPALRVVRGRVVQVCEKLSLKNDQWCLGVIVSANGLDLEMAFASEVLDKIFGITASELMARKKEIKTNPAAKEQINKTLRDSQLKIKSLNCEMVIRFSSVITKPVIIDVIQ